MRDRRLFLIEICVLFKVVWTIWSCHHQCACKRLERQRDVSNTSTTMSMMLLALASAKTIESRRSRPANERHARLAEQTAF